MRGETSRQEQGISRRRFIGASAGAIGAALAAGTSLAAAVGLSGCAQGAGGSDQGGSEQEAGASAANASAPKPVILVTSFGTSYPSSRHITIGAIESDIREAFPDYDVRRAFTAQTIIDHIEKDTGRHIDNFEEAMDKIVSEGVRQVIVQPTHLMNGFEYTDIANSLKDYEDKFDGTALGAPLLMSEEDQVAVANAIADSMKKYEDADTAICLMGHGTESDANAIYASMQQVFVDQGHPNYFVATVEATPAFDDVAKAAKDAGFTKAVLRPLMVVAGDHATNDMADTSDPESFASVMANAGFEVTSLIEGLGQLDTIDDIYVSHVQAAIDTL